jgi:hypothetical protein
VGAARRSCSVSLTVARPLLNKLETFQPPAFRLPCSRLHKHKKSFIRGTRLKTPWSTSSAHDRPAQLGPRCHDWLVNSNCTSCPALPSLRSTWPAPAKKQITWLQCLHLGSDLVTMFSVSPTRFVGKEDQQISTNSYTLLLLEVMVHGNQHLGMTRYFTMYSGTLVIKFSTLQNS